MLIAASVLYSKEKNRDMRTSVFDWIGLLSQVIDQKLSCFRFTELKVAQRYLI